MGEKPRFTVLSRRGFFKSMMGEVVSAVEEYQGKPQFRLSDLWELPDDRIARVKPMLIAPIQITTTDGHSWGQFSNQTRSVLLFEATKENLFVFEMFSKGFTLDEIGKKLSREMDWDDAQAFGFVKRLFLSLVESRVCVPGNQIG